MYTKNLVFIIATILSITMFATTATAGPGDTCAEAITVYEGYCDKTCTISTASTTQWFEFTCTEDGAIITVDSCCDANYGHDTYLRGVYDACGGNLIGYNDDGGCPQYWGLSLFQFFGSIGVSYKIEWGYYGSGTGTFDWSIDETYIPPNPGDNCQSPIIVTLPADLDYTDFGQTTCGHVDYYHDTAMGYYDGGEDIIYRLDVTENVLVCIIMDPLGSTWTGIGLFDDCPDVGNLLASVTGSSSTPREIDIDLPVGTYYIMCDSWPSPTCYDFDLYILDCRVHDVGVKEINSPFGSSKTKGDTFYAVDLFYDELISFQSDNPGVFNIIGSYAPSSLYAGTWGDDTWYAYDGATDEFLSIDETTGIVTIIGTTGLGTNGITGLAYDPTTDTMYGSSTTELYTIDIGTGAATHVGTMDLSAFVLGIASDKNGNLYGIDLYYYPSPAVLISIDPSTAARTEIGDTGLYLNYAQDMAYDKDNDILYLAAYEYAKQGLEPSAERAPEAVKSGGALYTADTSNGAVTLIGAFEGSDEVDALAIPYTAGPPPCNPPAVYPVEVTVKNYGHFTETFDVCVTIYDSGMVPIYGDCATIAGLVGGAEQLVSFMPWDATSVPEGLYTVEACTYLNGDENPGNDCKTQDGLICICFICADAGGPYVTDYEDGFQVVFDASGTFGPCPSGVYEYTWDFGDGSMPVTVTTDTITHTYADPCPDPTYSVYTATLTVTCQGYPCGDSDSTGIVVYGECYTDPPIVQWIYPSGGETLSGTVNLQWFALDDHDPFLQIYLYADHTKIAGPIANTGSYSWSSNSVSDGTYDFKVEAFSGARVVNFDTATATVDNGYAGIKVATIEITDTTTGSTQWVKNGDTVEISASITGAQHLNSWEITADLSGLGLGINPADHWDGYTAHWIITNIRTSDGLITITVTADDGISNSATITADNHAPEVSISKPSNGLYLFGTRILPISNTIIIGKIRIETVATDDTSEISKVEFYIDGDLKAIIEEEPFDWYMELRLLGTHKLEVKAFDHAGNANVADMFATFWNFFGS